MPSSGRSPHCQKSRGLLLLSSTSCEISLHRAMLPGPRHSMLPGAGYSLVLSPCITAVPYVADARPLIGALLPRTRRQDSTVMPRGRGLGATAGLQCRRSSTRQSQTKAPDAPIGRMARCTPATAASAGMSRDGAKMRPAQRTASPHLSAALHGGTPPRRAHIPMGLSARSVWAARPLSRGLSGQRGRQRSALLHTSASTN